MKEYAYLKKQLFSLCVNIGTLPRFITGKKLDISSKKLTLFWLFILGKVAK